MAIVRISNPAQDPKGTTPPAPSWIFVTPKLAQAWLDSPAPNRPLQQQKLRQMTGDLLSRDWGWCQDCIVIDELGRLTNGQNRLTSICTAGVGAWLLVAKDWPSDAQDSMDQGRSRTFGHQLGVREVPNANTVAAAARVIYAVDTGKTVASARPSNAHLKHTHERHPDIGDYAKAEYEIPHVRKGISYALAYLLCTSDEPEMASEFFKKVRGVNCQENDVEYLLRSTLDRRASGNSNGRLSDDVLVDLIVRAWNARYHGERITKLQRGSNGRPRIAGR